MRVIAMPTELTFRLLAEINGELKDLGSFAGVSAVQAVQRAGLRVKSADRILAVPLDQAVVLERGEWTVRPGADAPGRP